MRASFIVSDFGKNVRVMNLVKVVREKMRGKNGITVTHSNCCTSSGVWCLMISYDLAIYNNTYVHSMYIYTCVCNLWKYLQRHKKVFSSSSSS